MAILIPNCEECDRFEDPGSGTLAEIGAHWRADHPDELENVKAALALFQAQQFGEAWAPRPEVFGG